ncbi:MAG: phosphoenolpyruvate--protein phosphotransferase [Deltaproteobacteria bacterium]|nr:phosphoenolpyruvate--protein phosphotransferase [Deltaproteobacteria bacterium]
MAKHLETIANVTRILQKSRPEENPLSHIVTLVRHEMAVDVCSLYLLQGRTLLLVATDGLEPSSVGHVRMTIEEGLTGLAVEKRQPVVVKDAARHPRFKYFPETGEEKFHSFAAFPLMEREDIVGVLTLQTVGPKEFTSAEMETLKVISFQLAGVVYKLVALETVQSQVRREGHQMRLKGIPVAPGFGIGTAFFLTPGVDPVILVPGKGGKKTHAQSWKRVREAIAKTSTDLLRLEKKLLKKFSKQESDIFYSHRMILSDRSFQKKLKMMIDRGKGPIQAVRDVIGEYLREFEKIEDPHFKERAGDLEDIRQRLMEHLIGGKWRVKESWEGVLIAETLVPSDTARLDPSKVQGIITERGGVTSHAAILARSLGIPAVMGVSGVRNRVSPGAAIIVDGDSGNIIVNPSREVIREYERIQDQFVDRLVHLQSIVHLAAETLDHKKILLEANVGMLESLHSLREYGAEGIGLYRTEYPFMIRKRLPNEEEQFDLYKTIVEEANGLPVTFRTLDAGGDKPIASLNFEAPEANPFLGYRSIRLCLAQPEILEVQFRAMLRASALGPIRILIPMISGVDEIRRVREILKKVQDELTNESTRFDPKIPVGMMIEVPSAVQMAHYLIRYVDFFSVGTNDLTQYTLAVDRNNERVATFFDSLHPAVLKSIAHVAAVAVEAKKPVGICGEMAGDPLVAPLLVGLGITGLSMIPVSILQVKNIIRQVRLSEVRKMAVEVLKLATASEVREKLAPYQHLLTQLAS